MRGASDTAAAHKMETVAASADLAMASVLATRGDHEVRPLLDSALASAAAAEYRAFVARAGTPPASQRWRRRHLTAHAQLSQLFDVDGTPLHHHVSYLAIATSTRQAERK